MRNSIINPVVFFTLRFYILANLYPRERHISGASMIMNNNKKTTVGFPPFLSFLGNVYLHTHTHTHINTHIVFSGSWIRHAR